jgi:hypothetical protein
MGNAERAPRPRAPVWLRVWRVIMVLAVAPFALVWRVWATLFDGVLIIVGTLIAAARGL